jgi:hypothetical protein
MTKFIFRNLYLSLVLSAVIAAVSFAEDNAVKDSTVKDAAARDFENTVEKAKDTDSGDIAVKVAQKSSGAVWGKAKSADTKADVQKTEKTETPAAEKTTVKRPIFKQEESKAEENKTTERAGGVSPLKQTDDASADVLKKPVMLKSSRKAGSTDLVETLLEVSGDVKQVDNEMKSVSDKMEVVAGFRYEERIDKFSADSSALTSVRQYNLAKAKMKIGKGLKTPQLNEDMRTIVCTLDQGKVSLFSPKGSLRGEELLLVEDLPGNTLTLDRLLPDKEVKVGESWKIDVSVLKSFLSLDAVSENNVEAVLTAVADNMAMVELVGDVHGVYIGAPTEMTVRAKYQFDLKTQRINWLGLLIEENRSIGHVSPGFELVARLQVKISPSETPEALTDEVMKAVDKEPNRKVLELKYDAVRAPWHFLHSRDWYVYQDDTQTTILRKVHKGELVAQCNIADMGKVDVKTMTTLTKFQKELADGLGANFGKFVSAAESKNKRGNKVYRVLIDGNVDDLKLRWIYNLITEIGRASCRERVSRHV